MPASLATSIAPSARSDTTHSSVLSLSPPSEFPLVAGPSAVNNRGPHCSLLVKLPVRPLTAGLVFCWGVSLCGLAASNNFSSLAACRFLLGWFEAACLPLFSLITISWYRRGEQPLRVACWYGTNGLVSPLITYANCGLMTLFYRPRCLDPQLPLDSRTSEATPFIPTRSSSSYLASLPSSPLPSFTGASTTRSLPHGSLLPRTGARA